MVVFGLCAFVPSIIIGAVLGATGNGPGSSAYFPTQGGLTSPSRHPVVLPVGLIRIGLSAARGETPQFGLLFSGGSKFLPFFGRRFSSSSRTPSGSSCSSSRSSFSRAGCGRRVLHRGLGPRRHRLDQGELVGDERAQGELLRVRARRRPLADRGAPRVLLRTVRDGAGVLHRAGDRVSADLGRGNTAAALPAAGYGDRRRATAGRLRGMAGRPLGRRPGVGATVGRLRGHRPGAMGRPVGGTEAEGMGRRRGAGAGFRSAERLFRPRIARNPTPLAPRPAGRARGT